MIDFKSSKNSQNTPRIPASKKSKPNWGFNNRQAYKKGSILVLSAVFLLSSAFFIYKHYHQPKTQLAQQSPQPFGSILPDWWLDQYFKKSVCDSSVCEPDSDPDQDKLTNSQEYYYHSDPLNSDTNQNGNSDGQDVALNFDPSKPGEVAFADLENDNNVLGESLALSSDVKGMVSDSFDINKVNIPLVPDAKLNITVEENAKTYDQYQKDLQSIVDKYFPDNTLDAVVSSLGAGNKADMSVAATKAQSASIDLTFMQVPQGLVTYHKYMIATFQLIYDVITLDDYRDDSANPQSDVWYDKLEALLAVTQKMNLEKAKLTQ